MASEGDAYIAMLKISQITPTNVCLTNSFLIAKRVIRTIAKTAITSRTKNPKMFLCTNTQIKHQHKIIIKRSNQIIMISITYSSVLLVTTVGQVDTNVENFND